MASGTAEEILRKQHLLIVGKHHEEIEAAERSLAKSLHDLERVRAQEEARLQQRVQQIDQQYQERRQQLEEQYKQQLLELDRRTETRISQAEEECSNNIAAAAKSLGSRLATPGEGPHRTSRVGPVRTSLSNSDVLAAVRRSSSGAVGAPRSSSPSAGRAGSPGTGSVYNGFTGRFRDPLTDDDDIDDIPYAPVNGKGDHDRNSIGRLSFTGSYASFAASRGRLLEITQPPHPPAPSRRHQKYADAFQKYTGEAFAARKSSKVLDLLVSDSSDDED